MIYFLCSTVLVWTYETKTITNRITKKSSCNKNGTWKLVGGCIVPSYLEIVQCIQCHWFISSFPNCSKATLQVWSVNDQVTYARKRLFVYKYSQPSAARPFCRLTLLRVSTLSSWAGDEVNSAVALTWTPTARTRLLDLYYRNRCYIMSSK